MLSVMFGCWCDYLVDSYLYSCAGDYNYVSYSSGCTAPNVPLLKRDDRGKCVASMFISCAPSCCGMRLPVDLVRRETMARARLSMKIFCVVFIV